MASRTGGLHDHRAIRGDARALATTAHFAVLVGLAVLSGLAQGPTLTATITARRRYTPEGLSGQVSTTGASREVGAFAAGAAGGGALLTAWPPPAVILLVPAGRLVAASLGAAAARPKQAVAATP
ncbi:hypothetical protein ACRAKI_24860 [Saccharothrix isguenensis]